MNYCFVLIDMYIHSHFYVIIYKYAYIFLYIFNKYVFRLYEAYIVTGRCPSL